MENFSTSQVLELGRALLLGLFGLILISGGFGQTAAGLETGEIAFSYPRLYGLVSVELKGLNLGVARTDEGSFSAGLALRGDRSLSFKNWKLFPFLSGNFSPSEDSSPSRFTAGLRARYFDYKIGGWMLTSTSRLWVDPSSYRLSGDGSYSVGILSISYDFQVESGGNETRRWFPREEVNQIETLIGRTPSGISRLGGTYLALTGGKKVSVGETKFNWSQGITLDYKDSPASLGLASKVKYGSSSFTVLLERSRFTGWIFKLAGEKFSISYLGTTSRPIKHGVTLEYGKSTRLAVEVIQGRVRSGPTLNLRLTW